MKLFMPEMVFFEPSALLYPQGQKLYNLFEAKGIEIINTSAQRISRYIPGETAQEKYVRSKKSIFVTIHKKLNFDVCKPSADFQFSLVSNCPGHCEYCYLQTTQGQKPYLKVFVNLEDIFEAVKRHIVQNDYRMTSFEIASLGDPLSLEHLTGSVAETIDFFGSLENAKLRVVTKFNNVDSLLTLKHNGNTRFRVSVNSKTIIKNFEHGTADFNERIEAASKLAGAAYPIGFIIAPIMVYEGWKEEYLELFQKLKQKVSIIDSSEPVTFELIQHRFTPIAKQQILARLPHTKLDMDEEKRVLKWGKFGRFKYVYPKDVSNEIKEYLTSLINQYFPGGRIEYFT
jgi:spore photoproduct lyase